MSWGPVRAGKFSWVFAAGLVLTCVARAPAGSTLKDDEQLLLYPAWAKAAKAGWEVHVHGLVYEPERRRLLGAAVQRLARLGEHDLTSAERQILAERTHYFMVDDERGKRFVVTVGNREFPLGKSAANGQFSSRWRWPTNETTFTELQPTNRFSRLTFDVPAPDGRKRTVPLEVHWLEERGWSVISDLDDTIKISHVLDRGALLRNTFCRPFRPVPGMAELYQQWARQGAQFHYVTASPWQLYEPLAGFVRSNQFPRGTWHMKPFRWKDASAFELLASPERFKTETLEPLLRAFPQRHFLLVGDSGEKDPETYGALARKFPAQIRGIFIRDVTREPASARRYHLAFAGVPAERWRLFREASELQPAALPAE